MTLEEIKARKQELSEQIEKKEGNPDEIKAELDSLNAEEKSINEEIEKKAKEEQERKAQEEAELRKAEQEAEELRKNAAKINDGKLNATEIPMEEKKMENVIETRANEFAQSGKLSLRTVLGTGNIAKPTKAGGVEELAEVASSIVDDVNAIALTGVGAWTVGYKADDAEAADVTDGSNVGGTAATFAYKTINPAEIGIFDEISKQVKKLTPVDYMSAIEKSALIALRAKMASIIIAAVESNSSLAENKYSVALDAEFLKNVALGFKSIDTKGDVCLYLNRADLLTLGKVRGTNEKKALYDITFDAGNLNSGVIAEGGLAVRFRVLDGLSVGTQLFGQPKTIDMPMWDNYEVATDEGGEFFKKNMIGVRGLQTANADVVAYHGMQVIHQAEAE